MNLNENELNCYLPIDGGWRIRLGTPASMEMKSPGIGICTDDPRQHRRPLYPPADRSVFFDKVSPEAVERLPMRPVIVAFNAPRFIFDLHHAGGMMGHLLIGLARDKGESLWLNDFSDIEISYVNGRVEYEIVDPRFPGIRILLTAIALSSAAGIAIYWNITGADPSVSLLFCYGGASGASGKNAHQDLHFRPDHCLENQIEIQKHGFALRRKFKPKISPPFCLSRQFYPDGWEAEILGSCTPQAECGLGDPQKVLISPAALLASTSWFKESEICSDRVAVQRIRLVKEAQCGHMAAGMGQNMAQAIANPPLAYDHALKRAESIAGRVRIQTPDPYLNAAVVMMAFCLEGIWGDLAYLHGAWSWRFAYLGWRNWYGPNCYGWTERVKTSIENQIRLSLLREGEDKDAICSIIEFENTQVYYNMNEVFLDQVRHYFDYTDDIELMREIYPVLQKMIAWETRRMKPTQDSLYENALNTWISDSHWNIRSQCTQASAYMLGAHAFMARIAARLGEDAEPWLTEASRIREDMQRVLWQQRQGVFAEMRDTIGHKQIHPDPELPTIYHSAEFGAADSLQIHQMLHWVDTNLEAAFTAHGGKQVWSSNWHPNRGRSYTHTSRDMAPAENLNYGLTNYLGGRAEEGWKLICGTLCGIFSGPTPGGLPCHSHTDGTQRSNDEFADSISMWPRTVLEGLFGIVPNRLDDIVDVCPQFPATWPEASVETPHFSYRWKRERDCEILEWNSPKPTRVRLRLPIRATRINGASIEGKPVKYDVSAGIGLTWITIEVPEATNGRVEIDYVPASIQLPDEVRVNEGKTLECDLSKFGAIKVIDPQGILREATLKDGFLKGIVIGEPGPAVVYVEGHLEDCPLMVPLPLYVEPKNAIAPRRWVSPGFKDHNLDRWILIDLRTVFNAPLTGVVARVMAAAKPPEPPATQSGFEYRNGHFSENRMSQGRPGINLPVSDAAWRKKVGPEGIAWTSEGIPFKTVKDGDNIATVTLMGGFPEKIEIPINAMGKTLYLMVSGVTWPAQSHVINLRLTLHYSHGLTETRNLINPFDIGDCWDTWLGWWHDTAANGFENIGGRFGPAGSNGLDLTQPIEVDTEAHLLSISLQDERVLESIAMEAIANDVVFGIMGVSIRI